MDEVLQEDAGEDFFVCGNITRKEDLMLQIDLFGVAG